MKSRILSFMLFAGALCALSLTARAQVIQLNATINAAQEVPATTSTATGSAIMLYDINANTFDLIVSLVNFSSTLTDAHVQEATAGATGAQLVHFDVSKFSTGGSATTAVIRGTVYPGDRLKLLQNGAYLNFHSPQFPNGEIRGQLISQPKKLVANMTVAQEQAAFPAVALTAANLSDFGGAVMLYNPGTNRISLRISLFNFRNILNNSHFHEQAPGVSGSVVVTLGNNANATFANGGSYTTANGFIDGSFDIPYTGGDPIKLLTGGAYLNFHSTTFANGECRGQVRASDELPSSRVINLSTRGNVGAGASALIGGFSLLGPDPVRMLITAKGPSLTAFGLTGVLADPVLSLYDSGGRQIALNDNVGALVAGSELASLPGAPTNAAESALLVVLPPGNYTAVVTSANGGTGIALLEALDLRVIGPSLSAASVIAATAKPVTGRAAAKGTPEFRVSLPLAVIAVQR
jgi:hypothetical protein